MSWDRILWGVEFNSHFRDDPPVLLGKAWAPLYTSTAGLPGEPTRALLFSTRKQARDWCRDRNRGWAERNDSCSKWRVKPVRVHETVVKA
jgi:hypothetical protein